MSADIKWDSGRALQIGDRVRLTHDGDIIHGYINGDWDIHAAGNRGNAAYWMSLGYKIETAVPERTLPTEKGIYTTLSTWPPATNGYDLYIREKEAEWVAQTEGEDWMEIAERDLPDDLVRLVPVTEVEELRQRIKRVESYVMDVDGPFGAYSEIRGRIIAMLDGKASHV